MGVLPPISPYKKAWSVFDDGEIDTEGKDVIYRRCDRDIVVVISFVCYKFPELPSQPICLLTQTRESCEK